MIACETGLYGDLCHKECGHCRDINHCSNINGTCLTGCDVGYHRDLCRTRKWTGMSYQIDIIWFKIVMER